MGHRLQPAPPPCTGDDITPLALSWCQGCPLMGGLGAASWSCLLGSGDLGEGNYFMFVF